MMRLRSQAHGAGGGSLGHGQNAQEAGNSIMLLGPVFRAELVRTPRRVRYYTLRVLYGSALLFLFWLSYQDLLFTASLRGGRPRIDDFSRFALKTFTWFGVVQLGTVLLLIPPLFGSVIADEKQRKTMHYLMASRLSSGEIVVDKMAARTLHLGGFVLLGLPVMSILTLFGGVAWDYVLAAYLATCSSTFFAASLCILISTFARRVRQAVLLAYIAIIAWLIIPPFADAILSWLYPNFYQWFMPVNDWIEITSPLGMWTMYITRAPRAMFAAGLTGPGFGLTARGFIELYLWMVGLQVGAGELFILIAAWVLRPTFRRQEESGPRLTWFSPRAAGRAGFFGRNAGQTPCSGRKSISAHRRLHQARLASGDDHPDGLRDSGWPLR